MQLGNYVMPILLHEITSIHIQGDQQIPFAVVFTPGSLVYPLVFLLGGGSYIKLYFPVLVEWEYDARNEWRMVFKTSNRELIDKLLTCLFLLLL